MIIDIIEEKHLDTDSVVRLCKADNGYVVEIDVYSRLRENKAQVPFHEDRLAKVLYNDIETEADAIAVIQRWNKA